MTPRWLRARNLVIPLAVLGLIVVILTHSYPPGWTPP